ncbi:ATP-binding protein [Rufibacter psychrotolerans]|uniref:ATP-binding protein n=1 Tax=Rufibacter psychrotolerans TaxID=2812556 RepID=UPI0019676C41|nr:ATP-binding protein [Rufibacter sp. SYSU D00308]
MESFLSALKEQGIELLGLLTDREWKRKALGVTEPVALMSALEAVSKAGVELNVCREKVAKLFGEGRSFGISQVLESNRPYCLQEYDAAGSFVLDGFPASFEKVQLHEKPNKRLKDLHQTGVLSEEVESLLGAGFWEYAVESGAFFCTNYVHEVFAISSATPLRAFSSLFPYLREEDRSVLAAAWRALLETGKSLDCTLELPGRQPTWVRVKGKSISKPNGVVKLVGTVQEVTEYVEKEQALVNAREKAEQNARVKAEYVSHMSHEIRTPLNAIMGLTYLLLQEESFQEEHRDSLNAIHFSSQNLLALVNNTLDFSKIEAGKVELEKVNFHLKDLLKNTHQALCLRSSDKKVSYELSIDPRTPDEVAGDPVRLMQILNNLLSNAIKFTEKGSVKMGVEVIYQTDKEWVLEFSIADTGIGIPLEKQKRVFERFVQANPATHRMFGGSGLGLAITKNLVDLHKGSITLESTPGKGSVFTVRLRYTKPQSSLVTVPRVSSSRVTGNKLRGVKILVVDDNVMNKTVATKLLTSWHAEVDTAEDGLTALEKINTSSYDLVLMDLYMPVLDGFNAVAKLREAGQQVPVIALTANGNEEERRRIVEAGVQDYLSKPFVPQELLTKLLQLLENQKVYN